MLTKQNKSIRLEFFSADRRDFDAVFIDRNCTHYSIENGLGSERIREFGSEDFLPPSRR